MLRIAQACHQRGCSIRVYTFQWQGECPDWIELVHIKKQGWSSQAKNKAFTRCVQNHVADHPVDALIGFNKMPGLDVYYAADGCYEARVTELYGKFYRLGGRYRHFSEYENAVFGKHSNTEILMISELQIPIFQKFYDTPDQRLHMLPPGIARDRVAPDNAAEIRREFRREFNIADDEQLLLMVGSGFKTKGVDRCVESWAGLPAPLRNKTRLFVIGQDNPRAIKHQVKQLGLGDQFEIFAGRDDIPRFLLGADVLVHPARHENTGTVLVEALVAGLPVIVTDVCGYAHYVAQAEMGQVMPSPFSTLALTQALQQLLSTGIESQETWRQRGRQFATANDVYSMPETAAEHILRFAKRRRQ